MSAAPVDVLAYRAEIMVKGRFSGRFAPVVLEVRARGEKAARTEVRKQARKIGTPGQLVSIAEVQS